MSDNSTVISVTREAGSTNVCRITGVPMGGSSSFSNGGGDATAASGRVQFTVQSTSVPGQCLVAITTNNPTIAGTSASLTTQIVGAPNKLVIISNDSPHNASAVGTCVPGGTSNEASCTTIVVGVADVNGALVTSDNGRSITATPQSSCTGAGGGDVAVRNSPTTSGGKATFVLSSRGAYNGCVITFSSSGIGSANATAVWNGSGADHFACTFSPSPIVADGASQSAGVVTVRDSLNNVVLNGTYSVSFQRVSGNSTVLQTSSPQNTVGGYATFWVRSTTTAGTDTYGPVPSGFTLPGTNTSCTVQVQ